MPDISVILPAYNEKENIREAVVRAGQYLKRRFKSWEIVVVCDGGTDGTAELVERMAKTNRNLRLVRHPVNRGYGAALRSGFAAASGKLVFYTDADNQYDILDMDRLLPLANKFDVVAGYRVRRQDPMTRIIIGWVYNLVIRQLFGLNVNDVDCSFKLYKRAVFDKIKLRANTGLVDAEVLIKAQKAGFKTTQVGVRHFPRLKGRTIYEIGQRNEVWAWVNPKVPVQIFKEIRRLWSELI